MMAVITGGQSLTQARVKRKIKTGAEVGGGSRPPTTTGAGQNFPKPTG